MEQTEQKHTLGALSVEPRTPGHSSFRWDDGTEPRLVDVDGALVAIIWPRTIPEEGDGESGPVYDDAAILANAKHMAACWNACEGINPGTVPGLLKACETAIAIAGQELEAMKGKTGSGIVACRLYNSLNAVAHTIREALAAAKP